MSQVGPGAMGLPLFDAAPEEVQEIHDRMEARQGAFLSRVRKLIAGHYAGTGTAISTDEVHRIMAGYGIDLPPGASPNLLGSVFSGWPRARATGQVVRSKRRGANGNILRTWIID